MELFIIFVFFRFICADSSGDDDSGEISVPRAPKILGGEFSPVEIVAHVTSIKCEITEGSPSPSFIWLLNGKLVDDQFYETKSTATETVLEGKAFFDGNYTCVAVNFVGRATRVFLISDETLISNSNSTSDLDNKIFR